MNQKTNELNESKKIIRKYIRNLRCSLKYSDQYTAAQLITNKILTLRCIYNSVNIAVFISIDGEIQTNLLIKILISMNKHIYVPQLPDPSLKSKYLSFVPYTLSTPLKRNYLNTFEPVQKNKIISRFSIENLDIIFVPLVAFDEYGNRLGMGGGFYDITLKHCQNYHNCIIIGLGYDFQKIPNQLLPKTEWDIKLNKIITPSYFFWN